MYGHMLKNQNLYGILGKAVEDNPMLQRCRTDLVHSAAYILDRSHLVCYARQNVALQTTPLGYIVIQYCISHTSMTLYSRHLRPNMADIHLRRLFSLSGEFIHITVRKAERPDLAKLATCVVIPVKEIPASPWPK
jgi:pre-mRNA-splicing helicase BRR2